MLFLTFFGGVFRCGGVDFLLASALAGAKEAGGLLSGPRKIKHAVRVSSKMGPAPKIQCSGRGGRRIISGLRNRSTTWGRLKFGAPEEGVGGLFPDPEIAAGRQPIVKHSEPIRIRK